MSRSFRKNSIMGNCGGSDKKWKKNINKRLRLKIKQILKHAGADAEIFPIANEIEDEWSAPKDGKSYFDRDKYPKGLRN